MAIVVRIDRWERIGYFAGLKPNFRSFILNSHDYQWCRGHFWF